jgi:hypothetical protein
VAVRATNKLKYCGGQLMPHPLRGLQPRAGSRRFIEKLSGRSLLLLLYFFFSLTYLDWVDLRGFLSFFEGILLGVQTGLGNYS